MAEDFWKQGEDIDGEPGKVGDLVFWPRNSRVPWWIVEWQPQNSRVFVIVNAMGDVGVAAAYELSRDFRCAGGSGLREVSDG